MTPPDTTTKTPAQLALQAIESVDGFLAAAESAVGAIAADLRAGAADRALPDLVRILRGLESVVQLADGLDKVTGPALGGTTVDVEDLARICRRLVSSEERGDWTGLAELVDTELAPRFGVWRALFETRRPALAAQ